MTAQATTARSIHDINISRLDGTPASLGEYAGTLVLAVNVASRCGLTPQYAGLERLQEKYAGRGFTVLGFPCNQFGEQEPGSAAEISTFCSTTYGVTFPAFEKIEVNGAGRHPLFGLLTSIPDNEGRAGDVLWNFEKFLVNQDGEVVARFDPRVEPEDPRILEAIETRLG